MKSLLQLLMPLLIPFFIFAQTIVGEWKSYTAFESIKQMVWASGKIWAISSGGLLSYAPDDSTFDIYRTEDGLSSADLSTIAVDSTGNLWLGMNASPGYIDLFDPEKGEILTNFRFDLSRIIDFGVSSERIYAVYQKDLDYGLLEFRMINGEYQYSDFYPGISSSSAELTSVAVFDDSIFVGTNSGLLKASLQHPNLKDLNAWISDGRFQERIYDLAGGKDVLWISSESSLMLYKNGKITKSFGQSKPPNTVFTDADNSLYAVYNNRILHLNEAISTEVISGDYYLSGTLNDEGELWIGYSHHRGIGKAGERSLLPDSPVSNTFTALYKRRNGDLIAAGRDGISILQGNHWKNYVRQRDFTSFTPYYRNGDLRYFSADTIAYYPKLINSVVENSDNTVFLSVEHVNIAMPYDGGILQIDFSQPENYIVYDTTDGIIPGTIPTGSPHYIVVKGLTLDGDDNLWACIWAAEPPQPLLVRTREGKWYHFSVNDANGKITIFPLQVIADNQNRIYISNQSPGGISILDYGGSVGDKSDDRWYQITASQGLASNTVFSLDLDSQGNLWVITAGGVQEIRLGKDFDTHLVEKISSPVLTSIPFDLESRIKVDALDNKWIITQTAGVKIYQANGTWWNTIEGFTEENSALLSNRVLSVAFDEVKGLAYLATNRGISVLKTPFAGKIKSFSKVRAYPSPFSPKRDGKMIIDNLPPDASIKILTLRGDVVKTLTPMEGDVVGAQAYWDGKNEKGKTVTPGVYLLYFYSGSGKTGVTKIAVIGEK